MPTLTSALALGGATLFVAGIRKLRDSQPRSRTKMIDGMKFDDELPYPDSARKKTDDKYRYHWGRKYLDFEQFTQGSLMVGAPGSGKTVSMKLLMKGILPRIEHGENVRAIVYDSKTDLLPFMLSTGYYVDRTGFTDPGLEEKREGLVKEGRIEATDGLRFNPACKMVSDPNKVIILNPTDRRAKAWDMAADLEDRFQIETIAAQLLPAPPELGQNRYFSETAQEILAKVMIALHLSCPGRWRLKDVVLICQHVEILKATLALSDATKTAIHSHFNESTGFKNVLSTLRNSTSRFESIALAWEERFKQGQVFTTKEWITNPRLLVLGNNHRSRAPVQTLNRLVFSQIQAHLLDQAPGTKAENWVLLDEFRELGKIDDFNPFLITCRGKRTAVVMGFQDIAGPEEVYGEKNAMEIFACASNLALFHINDSSTKTQEWAAKVLGQTLNQKMQVNESDSDTGTTQGFSISEQRETFWMPNDFSRRLTMLKDSDKLHGVYSIGGYWGLNRPILKENLFNPKNGAGAKFVALDDPYVPAWDKLNADELPIACAWDTDDFFRLKIPSLRKAYQEIMDDPQDEKTRKKSPAPERPDFSDSSLETSNKDSYDFD